VNVFFAKSATSATATFRTTFWGSLVGFVLLRIGLWQQTKSPTKRLWTLASPNIRIVGRRRRRCYLPRRPP